MVQVPGELVNVTVEPLVPDVAQMLSVNEVNTTVEGLTLPEGTVVTVLARGDAG